MKTNMNKKIGYHITHNDADAVGCAYVAHYIDMDLPLYEERVKIDFKDRTYFCSIGSQDKVVEDIYNDIMSGNKPKPEIFIVSDISISEESCELLEKLSVDFGTEILGFDHHKTNNLNEKYSWFHVIKDPAILDDGRMVPISASMYMLRWLSDQDRLPDIDSIYFIYEQILAISDYDVWNWKNLPGNYGQDQGYDADITAIVCRVLGPELMLNTLIYDEGEERYPNEWDIIYRAEKVSMNKYLKSVPNKTRVYSGHSGYNIALIIGENQFANAAAELIGSEYSVDGVMMIFPSTNSVGLRTKRTNLDLSSHAKKYFNGGGHPQASGGRLDDNEFLELLKIFYTDSLSLEEFISNNNK